MIMKNQRVEDGVYTTDMCGKHIVHCTNRTKSQYSERIKGALVTMATIEFSSSYVL